MRRLLRAPSVLASLLLSFGWAAPSAAQLAIFEAPGITLGDDPVECVDLVSHRACESDAGSERLLSHDGLPLAERAPLDFHLFLPPAPSSGPDGNYPLVVFIHGWGGNRNQIGGGIEPEMIAYAEDGYAVLAYSARGWGNSCGSAQHLDPACSGQWNHLADARYEVRDSQYLAGLLVDELSDTGTRLVDPERIGATGVSYGAGQSMMLATLRDRVVNPDGTTSPWTSPSGVPLALAAAAPYWPWTDLAYALQPNGRTLDYVQDAPYFGPNGDAPFGVSKTTFVSLLFGLGLGLSVYAPPGEEPDVVTWQVLIDAGEPYLDAIAQPIADAILDYRSSYYWLDANVEPAPVLINQGWSDDIFPVDEPVRWLNRALTLHPDLPAALVVSDYGHMRATGFNGAGTESAALAGDTARAWLDHFLMDLGPEPGPAVRALTQSCPDGAPSALFTADSWQDLPKGEVRLLDATGGIVASTVGPDAASATAFDPSVGTGTGPCVRVPDVPVPGSISLDFPPAGPGGYTVLGSPTVVADIEVTGDAASAVLAARLLDVDESNTVQLLARAVYRPRAAGPQVFQLHPMGSHVAEGHHLQLEIFGNEAPTTRASNLPSLLTIRDVDVRIPVAEAPDGGPIQPPAPKPLPVGYLPEPGAGPALFAGLLALWSLRRLARRPTHQETETAASPDR